MIDYEKMKQHVMRAAQFMKQKVSEQNPSVTMKMEIWTRSNGLGQNKRYIFKIAGKEFEAEDCSIFAVMKVSSMLKRCCEELNKKKGYIVRELRDDFYYTGRDVFGNVTLSEEIVTGMVFLGKPCKEFVALQRYLAKYAHVDLQDLTLYGVPVCGKRGTNYKESGERCYYAHSPKMCKEILSWIRMNRKAGDQVLVGISEKYHCADMEYSRMYETESYGTFYSYLNIRIIKPDGALRNGVETWIYS